MTFDASLLQKKKLTPFDLRKKCVIISLKCILKAEMIKLCGHYDDIC